MYSAPILIDQEGNKVQLQRISMDGGFDEAWLQERLFENPYSLPINEIDPGYHQIAPLCIELNTDAGPVDIVYVTPQGRLVIVETKLWRNPDARRKVVGQILDYAKELIEWDYADLQREVSRRTGLKGNSPYLLAKQHFPDINEAQFVDGVSASLAKGDFMLIIAGDGIKKGVQGIVNFLENTAHMKFSLALVEVGVYKHPEDEVFVVQPRIIAKTELIERIVSSLDSAANTAPEETKTSVDEWRLQYERYWTQFLDNLSLDDPNQPLANPAKLGNIYFLLPPSGKTSWITVYFSKGSREVGCMLRFEESPEGNELFSALSEEKEAIQHELPDGTLWKERKVVATMRIPKDIDWPPFNSDVDHFFSETTNSFVNAFRHRLETLSEEF